MTCHITLAVAALPQEAETVHGLLHQLSQAMFPLLAQEDCAHIQRFSSSHVQCARWMARALLHMLRADAVAVPSCSPLRIQSTAWGAPFLASQPAASVSFSYSERAVMVAACWQPENHGLSLGGDIEDMHTAFCLDGKYILADPEQQYLHTVQHAMTKAQDCGTEGHVVHGCSFIRHELVRRWTVKEALLKAWGTGLRYPPHLLDCGTAGSRAGMVVLEDVPLRLYWRSVPFFQHWMSLACSMPFRLYCRCVSGVQLQKWLCNFRHCQPLHQSSL